MLEVKNLTKTFDGFRALDDLSMTVPKGAVYGLVGPNGAGKSTIIRHITGVYRPDEGEITMEGAPIYENPELKERIGYIPDDIFFFPSATAQSKPGHPALTLPFISCSGYLFTSIFTLPFWLHY